MTAILFTSLSPGDYMKNRKKIMAILSICLIIPIYGCVYKEQDTVNIDKTILSIINNQTEKEELITKSYDIDGYGNNFIKYETSLSAVNDKYEIECLREIETGFYAVFKDNNNGWLFVFFTKEDNEYITTDYWHVNQALYKSNFESIIVGESTFDDVKSIDPYGYEMFSILQGRLPFTIHETIDGYRIEISYNTDYTVADITFDKEENLCNNYVLQIDKLT